MFRLCTGGLCSCGPLIYLPSIAFKKSITAFLQSSGEDSITRLLHGTGELSTTWVDTLGLPGRFSTFAIWSSGRRRCSRRFSPSPPQDAEQY
mmetsp:Transcript_41620/g.93171  ORF Transcript_41620/g.93171 Transcript_41620/m.93171 type:complete len:92 (-) Transcript_41620:579-854(-)